MPWLVRNFRAFLPLVVSRRSRMCGRAPSRPWTMDEVLESVGVILLSSSATR